MAILYAFCILFYCFAAILGQSGSSIQLASGSGDSFTNVSTGSGGYAISNGSSRSGGEHLPAFVPPRTSRPVVEDEPQCDWCRGRRFDQCQTEDHPGCKCDAKCGLYGDCCADHPLCEPPDAVFETDPVFASMKCNTLYHSSYSAVYQETYWMVARCPEQVGRFGKDIQELHHDCSFGSTTPVTDQTTGIIYKNEFCAVCHSVTSFTRWSFTYSCREEFKDLLNMDSVSLNSLLESCTPCRYIIPMSVYNNNARELLPPRRCVVHVSTCLPYKKYLLNHDESLLLSEEQFENAVYHCHNDPFNAIGALRMSTSLFAWNVYRNIHCALCNGAAIPDSNQCTQYSTLSSLDLCSQTALKFRPNNEPPQINFGLLLDINKDGATTITTTETVTSLTELNTACFNNEVFDPSIGECRQIICPPGFAAIRGSCIDVNRGLLPPTGVAPDKTKINNIDDPDRMVNPDNKIAPDDQENQRNPKESLGTTQSPTLSDSDIVPTSNCYLVTLRKGHDNFTIIGNDSVIYEGVTFTVIAFDDFMYNPTICNTFISSNNASHIHTSYHQKIKQIKQIAPSLFIVPSLVVDLIIIGLQLFLQKLHSVYGFVIINFAVTFLLSNVFLLSTYHSVSSLDIIYFLWHTSSLAVACWLCIFIVHISLAFRKSCNSQLIGLTFSQKATLSCLYFTFGWGPALIVALIKNEMYSEWGPCLHDSLGLLCEPMPSSLTFFIAPLLIAVVFCALICVVISVKAIKSPQPLDKKMMRRFYIFLVLLIAFTMGWIFGFMYLLSPSPLVSTIAFFAFLSLKLTTVLLFFFGLVFSKTTRDILQKSFGQKQKNKVHPSLQKPQELPQIKVEEPTSVAVGEKTQGPLM